MELASKYLAPGERIFDNESLTSVNSSDYLVDPELKQREAEKMKGEQIDTPDGNVHISSVEGGGSDDDGYYVIESDPQNCVFPVGLDSPGTPKLNFDALASKLASLEVTNTIEKSHARRISDGSSSSSGVARSSEFKEVVIDGGGVQNVPMTVVRIGTAIVWEFSTEPKGIAFGIWYKEKKDSQKEVEVSDGYVIVLYIQWNLHKTDTIGEQPFGRYREVVFLRRFRLPAICMLYESFLAANE